MNNEVGAAPAAQRTSGLAIASLVLGLVSCLCLPAPFALIFGIVALVQMNKNPSLGGKGLAIAGIALSALAIPLSGILAAIAIPNFIKFQARAKQAECRVNLKAIAVAQQARFDDGFTENPGELGFSPEGNSRYAFLLGKTADAALYGKHKEAMSEAAAREALRKPLAGNVTLGIDRDNGNAFTAVCVGNIDSDDFADVWSISSIDREGPDGVIEAWTPFNEWSDLTDERGTTATGSGRSKFDD